MLPLLSICQSTPLPAFPGAEGYGMYATGGRGGDVYHVSNLNDAGEGSLRYGIQTATGARTIVFDISGNIFLSNTLSINKPDITIAGQTAPGEGITLAGACLSVKADNLIIRYIRVRLGDQSGGDDDAISINDGKNIILDHISASWSVDETLSDQSETVDSLTVQWCMVTESLNDSHHEKGEHGYGGIIGSIRQTFHHNLYAHHKSRNPKVTWRRHCKVDFRNNVIYNWGANSCYDGSSCHINWANNYYKSGNATKSSVRDRIFRLSDDETVPDAVMYETLLYAEGNYVDGFPVITSDNWKGGIDFDGSSEADNRALSAFDYPPITEQTAVEAYPLVLEDAGASYVRDPIDKRIINEVQNGTTTYGNGIIDSQDDVGGWPMLISYFAPTDTDRDGMPDKWEEQNDLDPDDPSDRNGISNPSEPYTNLERYLNAIPLNKPSSVEKYPFLPGYRVYPNPCQDHLILSWSGNHADPLTIRIYSITGKLSGKISQFPAKSNFLEMDMKDYKPGFYLVNISDARGNTKNLKIFKN